MTTTSLARLRVPLGFACGLAVIWLARPTPRSLAIGGAIAVGGEFVRFWAAGHLEKGREVTRSGPYRLTRHPLYLGSAIIASGAAVASARVIVAIVIAAYFSVTTLAAIRAEEAAMRRTFGDEYDAYAEARATPVKRTFSLERALKNREYRAVAGLLAAGAILALKMALR
jgi:protein-S-isoprenylcysteine O-methyltransferase Ste14